MHMTNRMADATPLWSAYKDYGRSDARDKLVDRYLFLAKYAVDRFSFRGKGCIDQDDLVSYAMIGLMEAIDSFQPERGIRFETFAMPRVRGAVLDALRRLDWVPRAARKQQQDVKRAYAELEARLGRPPSDEDVCHYLQCGPDQLHDVLTGISRSVFLSLDDVATRADDPEAATHWAMLPDPSAADPCVEALRSERRDTLAAAIHELPERERSVIFLYYYHEMTLKEVGAVLGVGESRVCQLHAKALLHLQDSLGSQADLLAA